MYTLVAFVSFTLKRHIRYRFVYCGVFTVPLNNLLTCQLETTLAELMMTGSEKDTTHPGPSLAGRWCGVSGGHFHTWRETGKGPG